MGARESFGTTLRNNFDDKASLLTRRERDPRQSRAIRVLRRVRNAFRGSSWDRQDRGHSGSRGGSSAHIVQVDERQQVARFVARSRRMSAGLRQPGVSFPTRYAVPSAANVATSARVLALVVRSADLATRAAAAIHALVSPALPAVALLHAFVVGAAEIRAVDAARLAALRQQAPPLLTRRTAQAVVLVTNRVLGERAVCFGLAGQVTSALEARAGALPAAVAVRTVGIETAGRVAKVLIAAVSEQNSAGARLCRSLSRG